MELNKMTIQKLVTEALNLPPSLMPRFEIEAARLQLGACLHNFEVTFCYQNCDPADEFEDYENLEDE